MKRRKLDSLRFLQILIAALLLYFLFSSFDAPDDENDLPFELLQETTLRWPPKELRHSPRITREKSNTVSTLLFQLDKNKTELHALHKAAMDAWRAGKKLFSEIEESEKLVTEKPAGNDTCPDSLSVSGAEFASLKRVVVIPCGLAVRSHVTVVGTPMRAHPEYDPRIAAVKEGGDEAVMVSQFMVELQGLRNVEGEDPPRVLHFNPRLKGDWSDKPVIEMEGSQEPMKIPVKCEKWMHDDDDKYEGSKAIWWLNRLVGRRKKVAVEWPYPFAEGRMFVLTLTAGLKGYHISVDGRHVTSFPYRTGFALEDATGLFVNGYVDVHYVFAGSLPTSHPSFAPEMRLEMVTKWKAPPLPNGHVELFIGIISAGNHFAERMAVRKSWMQHEFVKSSRVVARFFVALVRVIVARRRVSNLQEWPEEEYPIYANGPGYIISSDIAKFVISEFETNKLRLFKMEDVSMGVWVEQLNNSKPVKYVDSLKFCQYGCVEDYYTAHYQSPRQMICLWHNLQHNRRPQCCNMR